jgi:hypothetical protein
VPRMLFRRLTLALPARSRRLDGAAGTDDRGSTRRAGDDAGRTPTARVGSTSIDSSLHETCLIITGTIESHVGGEDAIRLSVVPS